MERSGAASFHVSLSVYCRVMVPDPSPEQSSAGSPAVMVCPGCREQYDRAKGDQQARRMEELDAAYQRDQLMLEVLLDVRDLLAVRTSLPQPTR